MTPSHEYTIGLFRADGSLVHTSEAVTETEARNLADQMMRNRDPREFRTLIWTVSDDEPLHDSRRGK